MYNILSGQKLDQVGSLFGGTEVNEVRDGKRTYAMIPTSTQRKPFQPRAWNLISEKYSQGSSDRMSVSQTAPLTQTSDSSLKRNQFDLLVENQRHQEITKVLQGIQGATERLVQGQLDVVNALNQTNRLIGNLLELQSTPKVVIDGQRKIFEDCDQSVNDSEDGWSFTEYLENKKSKR